MDYLRDPATPGNQVEEGEPTLAERFRQASAQLARMYAHLLGRSGDLADFRDDIAFFEEDPDAEWPGSTPRSARPAARPSRRTSSCT